MSRYDRAALTKVYVAQETRKAARSGDAMYAQGTGRERWHGAIVNTKSSSAGGAIRKAAPWPDNSRPAPAPAAALTLPWPPTGNHAVKHANGAHYLRPEVIAYRDRVADICARFAPIAGRYILHVHLSPPDARARDMDNALKSLNDALVKAGYLPSDAMTHMRELHVTTDDERAGKATVRAVAI